MAEKQRGLEREGIKTEKKITDLASLEGIHIATSFKVFLSVVAVFW